MLLPPHLIARLPRRGWGLRDSRLCAPKELRRLRSKLRLVEFEGCAALRRLRLRRLRRRLLRLVVVFEDVCQSFFDFEHMAPGGGPEKP
jgi:hypothetical protein